METTKKWNELIYNNPNHQLKQSTKTLTAANNTKIQTLGTIQLDLTPERISINKYKTQQTFRVFFFITQCNHNILGTPFFREYIENFNVNTRKLTIDTNKSLDNDITFFQNST